VINYKLERKENTISFRILNYEIASIPKGLMVFPASNGIQVVIGHYPINSRFGTNLISLKADWKNKAETLMVTHIATNFPTETIADLYLQEYKTALDEMNQELVRVRNKTGLRIV
jgi:hypothetical protein